MFETEKYIQQIIQRVRNYSLKSGVHNFSCPICGDSQKNKFKARGNIYPKGNDYSYKCFNCGFASKFNYFLKTAFPDLFEEYRRDVFQAKLFKKKGAPPSAVVNRIKKFKELEKVKIDLPRILDLNKEHDARIYMESRRLPLDRFYFAECWKTFIKQYDEEKSTRAAAGRPCIIIPCINRDNKLIGFQARNLNPNAVKRYETYQTRSDVPVVYGLDRINYNKSVYVTEGPFDSTFLDNAIAVLASGMEGKIMHLELKDPVLIYDNEPRNKEIVKLLHRSIEGGFKVVIFPKNIVQKDLNDMALAGINVKELIKTNTYKGLKAELKFKSWQI